MQALARAPTFAALTGEQRRRLAPRFTVVELHAHEVLWREGQEPRFVGLVLLGRLALERARARVVIVDIVGAGDVIGELPFVLGMRTLFDVRCLRRARVALLPTHELRALVEDDAAAAMAMAGSLAQQALRLTRRLEALSAGTVEQRLARVVVGLSERFGVNFPGGVLVPVRLRREDLASLAATTLESASRQLSRWARQGRITPQPAGILIRDLQALRALAESPWTG